MSCSRFAKNENMALNIMSVFCNIPEKLGVDLLVLNRSVFKNISSMMSSRTLHILVALYAKITMNNNLYYILEQYIFRVKENR